MRTITVNLKIVTQAEGDEDLSKVVSCIIEQIALHPKIKLGAYESGEEFTFQYNAPPRHDMFVVLLHPDDPIVHHVNIPEFTAEAKVTATYENEYTLTRTSHDIDTNL